MPQEIKSKNVHFASALKTLLDEKGMTNAQLAALIDVTPTSVGNYCNGREPKSGELLRLSKVFGVSMEHLLTGKIPATSTGSDSVWKIKAEHAEQKLSMLKSAMEGWLKKI